MNKKDKWLNFKGKILNFTKKLYPQRRKFHKRVKKALDKIVDIAEKFGGVDYMLEKMGFYQAEDGPKAHINANYFFTAESVSSKFKIIDENTAITVDMSFNVEGSTNGIKTVYDFATLGIWQKATESQIKRFGKKATKNGFIPADAAFYYRRVLDYDKKESSVVLHMKRFLDNIEDKFIKEDDNKLKTIRHSLDMNKIVVIGCPGSGKSTLTFKLEKLLKYPVLHLDKIYHIDNEHHITREELVNAVNQFALSSNNWIIDGNYISTVEQRIKLADTIILFNISTRTCVKNAYERAKHEKGSDMADGFDYSKVDENFIKFIKSFKTDALPKIIELYEKYKSEKNFIVFNNYKQVDKFVSDLESAIK